MQIRYIFRYLTDELCWIYIDVIYDIYRLIN